MAICVNWHPFYSLNNHQGPQKFHCSRGLSGGCICVSPALCRLFVSPFSPSKTFWRSDGTTGRDGNPAENLDLESASVSGLARQGRQPKRQRVSPDSEVDKYVGSVKFPPECECESTSQDDESRSNLHVLVYWESKLHKPSFPTIVISMFMSTSLFFIEGMCVDGLSSWRPRNSFRKETSPTHGVPYFPLNSGCLIGIWDLYNGFL